MLLTLALSLVEVSLGLVLVLVLLVLGGVKAGVEAVANGLVGVLQRNIVSDRLAYRHVAEGKLTLATSLFASLEASEPLPATVSFCKMERDLVSTRGKS